METNAAKTHTLLPELELLTNLGADFFRLLVIGNKRSTMSVHVLTELLPLTGELSPLGVFDSAAITSPCNISSFMSCKEGKVLF